MGASTLQRWPARSGLESGRSVLAGGALAALAAGAVAIAATAAAGPSSLAPSSRAGFPEWLSGPLSGIGSPVGPEAFKPLLVAMCAAYALALACGPRALPARVWWGAILALHAIFLVAPPLLSTDVFGYLGYARLGASHGIDPYVHGAGALHGDPVRAFLLWHQEPTPYGPLFTVTSYALAPLPVPTALWMLKAIAALASLGTVVLVARGAGRAGRDPVAAAIFVGLNPVLLVYAVGGAHNDALAALLATAGAVLLLQARNSVGGAALAAGAAVKATVVLVVPVLLLGARKPMRAALGAGAAAAGVALVTLAAFGPEVTDIASALSQQGGLVSQHSVPSVAAGAVGAEVTSTVQLAGAIALAAVLALFVVRTVRGHDPIAGAGWTMLAALVTTSWLMPWYVASLLPLAALSPSPRLRVASLAMCAFVVAARPGFS